MIKKIIKRTFCVVLSLILAAGLAVLGINGWVTWQGEKQILPPERAVQLTDVDCILVLGCGVKADGTPSDMLHDRLKRGIELYRSGAAPKLLMSGDHGQANYDEVNTMKTYAVGEGVPSEDVFMDHAGFSTYESLYRAKEIFGVKKLIIVTQKYHLYRAIHIARSLGMEAYGIDGGYRTYSGQAARDIREILARVKDVASCIFLPEPTYLGDSIPISGNGDMTNDKYSDF